MQELFALQRWRRMSILKDYNPSGSSGSNDSSNTYSASNRSLGGGLEWGRRRGLGEGTAHSRVQEQSTVQNTSRTHALTSALTNVRTNTAQGTDSGSVDGMFNRHLYGGGVLSSVEVNYFITHLSTSTSTSTCTTSRVSGGVDTLYSFFVGADAGCEVGNLYSFHDELACHVSNRTKQRALAELTRIGGKQDRHTDYHTALNDTQGNVRNVSSDSYFDNGGLGLGLSFGLSAMHLSNYGVLCVHADSDVARDGEDAEGAKEVVVEVGSAGVVAQPVRHSSGFIEQHKARATSSITPLTFQSSTSHRQLQLQLQHGCPGVTDLMPLSVQLGLLVTQPLQLAKATELYAAVTALREKHRLGSHFKCKMCLSYWLKYTVIST